MAQTSWWDGRAIVQATELHGKCRAVELDVPASWLEKANLTADGFDQLVMVPVRDALFADSNFIGFMVHQPGHWTGYSGSVTQPTKKVEFQIQSEKPSNRSIWLVGIHRTHPSHLGACRR